MDFQSINPFNVRLNLISGNMLPMNNGPSHPIIWKIYSISVWLLELVYIVTLILACFIVPIEKVLNDGLLILVVATEAVFIVTRIHSQTALVQQIIRKLNEALRIEDKNMRNIVITNLKPMEIPFKCYLVFGTFSVCFWCSLSFPLMFEKNDFYYIDFRSPNIYSKEPFSVDVFLLGSVIALITNIYIFLKKISVDVYTTQIISLITSQYQYIATKLVLTFRNSSQQNNSNSRENIHGNSTTEKELKNICRLHNNVMR